jgi:hypothetical protein
MLTPTRASRSPQPVRLADGFDDALAQPADVGLALGPRLDDGEFVAADPRHRIGVTQQRTQPRPHLADQFVARRVAERVVDLLEMVEVEHEQRDLLARAAVAVQRLPEPVLKQCAVRQAGERIVQRLVLGGGFALLDLGDEVGDRLEEEGHDEDHGHGRRERHRPDRGKQLSPGPAGALRQQDHREIGQDERRYRR